MNGKQPMTKKAGNATLTLCPDIEELDGWEVRLSGKDGYAVFLFGDVGEAMTLFRILDAAGISDVDGDCRACPGDDVGTTHAVTEDGLVVRRVAGGGSPAVYRAAIRCRDPEPVMAVLVGLNPYFTAFGR